MLYHCDLKAAGFPYTSLTDQSTYWIDCVHQCDVVLFQTVRNAKEASDVKFEDMSDTNLVSGKRLRRIMV
jgi:hypothetical protein